MRPLERLVLATHNKGKLNELKALLAPLNIDVRSAADFNLPEPEETGETFAQNAAIKAHAAAQATGWPALSDDSGFCVESLQGQPGVHSARWAGPDKDFTSAMRKVKEACEPHAFEGSPCHFVCALCLAWPDGHADVFEGIVEGTGVWPPKGDQGFGYDPIFQPHGHERTFGEMSADEKHGLKENQNDDPALSHRARAFLLLLQALKAAQAKA